MVLLIVGLAPLPRRRCRCGWDRRSSPSRVILGEMLRLLAEEDGLETVHYREFGGTRIVFDALAAGEIDVYPEYTGTITQEIFAGQKIPDEAALRRSAGRDKGIAMSELAGLQQYLCLGSDPQAGCRAGNFARSRICSGCPNCGSP